MVFTRKDGDFHGRAVSFREDISGENPCWISAGEELLKFFFVRIRQGVSSLLALFHFTQPQKKHRDDGRNPAITTWDV